MRPSTMLRIARMNALMSAFAVRDMGHLEAATLLQCSQSSARNYMFELMDAGVIIPADAQGRRRAAKPVYRLNHDTRVIDGYKAELGCTPEYVGARTGANPQDRAPKPVQRDRQLSSVRLSDRYAGSPYAANEAAVQRDPLVAALFGARIPTCLGN